MTEISDALVRDIQAAMGALVRQQRPGLSHEVVQLDMPIGQMKTLFILWAAGKPQTMAVGARAGRQPGDRDWPHRWPGPTGPGSSRGGPDRPAPEARQPYPDGGDPPPTHGEGEKPGYPAPAASHAARRPPGLTPGTRRAGR